MRHFLIPLIAFTAVASVAGPAAAEIRYLAYDASDRVTQALTRGITLEANRGLFGAISVRRIISTSNRGSADIRRGGPDAVRRALPAGSRETSVYTISPDGGGRGLSRALCPGSEEAWMVLSRVRLARPMTVHAVGRWSDGTFRHCVQLSYDWRGEWAVPPAAGPGGDAAAPIP
ncbi:MAG: hypothetical protein KKC29_15670 [Alphaproteobacteria bacterium]|nr:hypothetical protein [Alphaproteobacteria bacterium]MBU2041882.1 hypothetical protein [Alphaproteobacteria bacterium]MBU2125819.1 hypothetical protein [Alphaproteobacteria bacterium]MBU2292530.1 hypothetical protein [Alphaproteobacteria bacterium]MBU2397704.1 hypothetical protein [Alphaproteobacteria bacterium]